MKGGVKAVNAFHPCGCVGFGPVKGWIVMMGKIAKQLYAHLRLSLAYFLIIRVEQINERNKIETTYAMIRYWADFHFSWLIGDELPTLSMSVKSLCSSK